MDTKSLLVAPLDPADGRFYAVWERISSSYYGKAFLRNLAAALLALFCSLLQAKPRFGDLSWVFAAESGGNAPDCIRMFAYSASCRKDVVGHAVTYIHITNQALKESGFMGMDLGNCLQKSSSRLEAISFNASANCTAIWLSLLWMTQFLKPRR